MWAEDPDWFTRVSIQAVYFQIGAVMEYHTFKTESMQPENIDGSTLKI